MPAKWQREASLQGTSLWYVAAAVEGRRPTTGVLAAIIAAAALGAVGCGGDGRQDENEPSGTYRVDIVSADFPRRQHLGQQEELRIAVRNTGNEAVPNLSVTVDGFAARSDLADVADASRPLWIVDDAPRGGDTAYVNTWALGRLPAGATRTFTWKVTSIQSGEHPVRYRVNAGLHGKAKATLADNAAPEGMIRVNVATAPSQTRVDPETGDVIRENE
jgi:hypothetical protein